MGEHGRLTPFEVLGISPELTGPERIRQAYERRLKQFEGKPNARHFIKTAYDLLRSDPSGADPYDRLKDRWGKWAELVAEVEELPPVEAEPIEGEPVEAPTVEPEPVDVEPARAEPEEAPPAADVPADFEARFRSAAGIGDPKARHHALKTAAHELGDLMYRNRSLLPLWARLVLAYCGGSGGVLSRIVRRTDLALDLKDGDGSVAAAVLDEAEAKADFAVARHVAATLQKHVYPSASPEHADLALRCADMLAVAWPRSARNLLALLEGSGKLASMSTDKLAYLERRIFAGQEMRVWSRQVRNLIARAERMGGWDEDLTRPGTSEARDSLAKLATLAASRSELVRLVRERAPSLLARPAEPSPPPETTAPRPLPPPSKRRKKPRSIYRQRARREERAAPARMGLFAVALIFAIFLLGRACSAPPILPVPEPPAERAYSPSGLPNHEAR